MAVANAESQTRAQSGLPRGHRRASHPPGRGPALPRGTGPTARPRRPSPRVPPRTPVSAPSRRKPRGAAGASESLLVALAHFRFNTRRTSAVPILMSSWRADGSSGERVIGSPSLSARASRSTSFGRGSPRIESASLISKGMGNVPAEPFRRNGRARPEPRLAQGEEDHGTGGHPSLQGGSRSRSTTPRPMSRRSGQGRLLGRPCRRRPVAPLAAAPTPSWGFSPPEATAVSAAPCESPPATCSKEGRLLGEAAVASAMAASHPWLVPSAHRRGSGGCIPRGGSDRS